MVNDQYQNEIKENRHYIKTLCECLLCTCTQDIAQHGHDESVLSLNKGNLRELMLLLSKHDTIVQKKLQDSTNNAKYLHHDIQNLLISIMASFVRKKISDDVKKSKFFAIMSEETKDLSKNEQITVIVRYLHQNAIQETFLGFKSANGMLDAANFANYIKTVLDENNILLSKCIAQGYDGAAVMSGHLGGVQNHIKSIVPQAVYIHCFNHKLNLVVVDCFKHLKESANFFSNLEKLYTFMSNSTIHPPFLNTQKQIYPTKQARELKRICETRWTVQFRACETVLETIESIFVTLNNLISNTDVKKDRRYEAKGLLLQIDKEFIVLFIFIKILKLVTTVSNYLQSPNMNYIKGLNLVQEVINEFQNLRNNDNEWNSVWKSANNIFLSLGLDKTNFFDKPKRMKSIPKRLQEFIVDCEIDDSVDIEVKNEKYVVKLKLYIPILDKIIIELKERFTKNDTILKSLQAFEHR